jgi:phosphopentomutase
VMDSVGIGGAPDAAAYGDQGADTIGHIAAACARGKADRALRDGPLHVPHLVRLGLGRACELATGRIPAGLERLTPPDAAYGCAAELSKGKDTPSGHWEIAGLPVPFEWGYFRQTAPCFPANIIEMLCRRADLPGILGNKHASGTEIIAEHGEEHMRTGKPICYTSADSVFQIAAHEQSFGLERLYQVCQVAYALVEPLRIGRVIARPFVGTSPADFARTGHRRDFSIRPPSPTLLDHATQAGRDVVTIGKIGDIFAHSGTGRVLTGHGNQQLFDRMMDGVRSLADGGLLFANFIDFDTLFGHRRNLAGYAGALEAFDARLPELQDVLWPDDVVIITSDHGCDPSWHGTDHTREQIPVLAFGAMAAGSIGRRSTFADIAATAAAHLDLPGTGYGTAFDEADGS